MPDMTTYFGHQAPDAEVRAALAWQRIMDNPTSITVLRGSTTLSAQTVRIEHRNLPAEVPGGAGTASTRRAIVFGVRGHASITDTDLKKGDRFVLNGSQEYRVIDVVRYPGEIQATAERSL